MIEEPLTLKPLPYPYGALHPVMSAEQVRLHHERNQAAYVRNANRILEQAGGELGTASPTDNEKWLFNANGALLHELFWETYAPGGRPPSPSLCAALSARGTEPAQLVSELRGIAHGIQGSGWAALSEDASGRGDLVTHPVFNHSYDWELARPLILVDVWEHAYAETWWNNRPSYVDLLLPLIDWHRVEERLASA